ncbi:MAG: PAAR domain-containing protein [Myxococcales bacterium]|nr:PAAR domain-containing protein [Myxococcales bacterium]MBK7198406.1 PAAR domain-containing protein [Myxococcales bacterium]MBP6842086.1 PAAR domain-containing protein [Kofleriaceae bacterium]
MPPAARKTDNVLHDSPHCHAPIHPPAPVPTPVPHPPIPHPLISATQPTIKINNLEAATITSITKVCTIPPCVPNGPGMVAKGSSTVIMSGLPAARMGDMVQWAGCVAPIPSPTGKIIPPCSPTVIIGG